MKIKNCFEDEYQEFKLSLSQLDNGIDSLAAMLNKHCSGTVYYGIDDNGNIVGLNEQIGKETIKKISSRVSEILKPSIVPEISIETIDDKLVIKLFARGNNRPYCSRGYYLIRSGSENKKIDPNLLGKIFFSSQATSIENVECFNQDLTFRELKQLYINAGLTINENNFEKIYIY